MGIYNIVKMDIPAIYSRKDKMVKCFPCIDQKDWEDLMEKDIISYEEIKDSDFFHFCDICKMNLRIMLKQEKSGSSTAMKRYTFK
jgi:hypothetical protein